MSDLNEPNVRFSGAWFVVSNEVGAVESHSTRESAERAVCVLNEHARRCGHSCVYYVEYRPRRL